MQLARTFAVPTVNWVWPIAQISVDGRSLAKISATCLTCASGRPVTRSTSSGVHFVDLFADLVEAIDALADEFLVLPAVLENVPQHAVDRRNVGAGAHPHIFGRMRRGARHSRIDDDHVGAIELLAFQNMLQRDRMRLGRIAAHDHDGLGVADIVVAVGHRAVAPGIGYAGDGGGMTDARLMIGIIGSPERGELAIEIGGLVGEFGGAKPVDRVRVLTCRGSP